MWGGPCDSEQCRYYRRDDQIVFAHSAREGGVTA
jgi:hypothetical protein